MATNPKILWVDDEIDFLKPHIMFLESKGYDVTPVVSGADALALLKESPSKWNVVLLDENMPGMNGLETLEQLKTIAPFTPVVMITKSEEENLMEQALGKQIKDYLIKPVNPIQILHSLKKLLDSQRLVTEQATANYRREFMELDTMISQADSFSTWSEVYRRFTLKRFELNESAPELEEMLASQYVDAQKGFFRFVKNSYIDWVAGRSEAPLMSHRILDNTVKAPLADGEKVTLIVMDNFRLDQWIGVKPHLAELFNIEREEIVCSLLPTATQYARNALFSGMLPETINRRFPDLWIDEDAEESKNINEEPLVEAWLKINGLDTKKLTFHKANNSARLNKLIKDYDGDSADLCIYVINFIDILSHARTESNMIRELASTDAAYVSLTKSWFRHSPIMELLRRIAASNRRVFFTTDHGSILVNRPVKVVAERNTNVALRYKLGRNLAFPAKEVFHIAKPKEAGLPCPNLSTTYIFAGERDFFAYQNNFNYYVKYYTDTYQHGGVSFEEMMIPLVELSAKQ